MAASAARSRSRRCSAAAASSAATALVRCCLATSCERGAADMSVLRVKIAADGFSNASRAPNARPSAARRALAVRSSLYMAAAGDAIAAALRAAAVLSSASSSLSF